MLTVQALLWTQMANSKSKRVKSQYLLHVLMDLLLQLYSLRIKRIPRKLLEYQLLVYSSRVRCFNSLHIRLVTLDLSFEI